MMLDYFHNITYEGSYLLIIKALSYVCVATSDNLLQVIDFS